MKPSNILLSPEGPKLCDFGIARLEGSSTLTESAALLGSLRYMAPEQRWGKSDERSDLYALGVVLHEALALGVPGEKPLPPGTPRSVTRLISKLTETSPALRPPSAALARRMLLGSSRRPLMLAVAVSMVAVFAGIVFFPRHEAAPQPLAVRVIIDAGPGPALAVQIPDAGVEEVEAGVALQGVPSAVTTLGTGTKSPRAPGKPVKKPVSKMKSEADPEPGQ